ncbi:hypothetical protein PIGHUM_02801 [Pigmentiphaga humi]|uniref:Pyoverdine/dityrosine biosynthesis protein n=1 Tax=Pigmentiphaga humi TaxID=2478468 RepID=A0A3P4B6B8_9BURK|nr:hypothetical protein [Pigmentiphaga humi]VCU70725.1 hypothetical protein PIGHUM_02801 [Pigmentiphaga humi]
MNGPVRIADTPALDPVQRQALAATLQRLSGAPDDPAPPALGAPAEALLQAVLARPWRRSAACSATVDDLRRKLAAACADGQPLVFTLPFGGYKSWRLAGAPDMDWAELFWIDYLRHYAARLAALHPPGVELHFTYLHGVLGWVNQLELRDQDRYIAQLRALLAAQSSPRVRLQCIDLAAPAGGPQAVLAELRRREASAAEPTAPQLASAARNLVHPGAAQGQPPSGPAWQAAVRQAARRCAAMESLEFRRRYNKFGPRIQLTHIRGASLAVHLGSCRSAIVQPWVASGYLTWRGGQWLECLDSGAGTHPACADVAVDHRLAALAPGLGTLRLALPSSRAA